MTDTPPLAFVTGGAKRIGRAIVEDLAAHGWAVAIHCNHSRNEAEALADAIRRRGGRTAVVAGDLGDLTGLDALLDQAERALGKSSLLVNSASMFERDEVGGLDPDLWTRQLAVNTAPSGVRRCSIATSSRPATRSTVSMPAARPISERSGTSGQSTSVIRAIPGRTISVESRPVSNVFE